MPGSYPSLLEIQAYDEQIKSRQKAILDELTAEHQPANRSESSVLSELARAHRRLEDLHKSYDSALAFHRSQVAAKFEADCRAAFLKHERQWRKEPGLFQESFAKSYYGAKALAVVWLRLADRLELSRAVVGLDDLCDALLAEGLSDRVQHQADEGWWLMARFLAIHSAPGDVLKAWIKRSKCSDPLAARSRADLAMAAVPEANEAAGELLARARQRARYWEAQVAVLEASHRKAAELCRESVHADRRVAAGLKNIQALIKLDQKSVERMEKRLHQLQAQRHKTETAGQRRPAKPAAANRQVPKTNGLTVPEPQPESIMAPLPMQLSYASASHDAEVPQLLDSDEIIELELDLEAGEIKTIHPVHAAQLFGDWLDKDIFDKPAYKRFHEVFGHFSDKELLRRLKTLLEQEARERQEVIDFLDSA